MTGQIKKKIHKIHIGGIDIPEELYREMKKLKGHGLHSKELVVEALKFFIKSKELKSLILKKKKELMRKGIHRIMYQRDYASKKYWQRKSVGKNKK